MNGPYGARGRRALASSLLVPAADSVRPMGRYDALTEHLRGLSEPVTLSFAELEQLTGSLPPSARRQRPWWANTPGNTQSAAWLAAGHVVVAIDLASEQVTFARGERRQRSASPAPTSTPRPSSAVRRSIIGDGTAALADTLRLAGWRSVESAVAAHTVFLHPDTVRQTEGRALFPVVRDPTRRGQFGTLPDGRAVLFDDNATPTDAFLWSADRVKGPDVQFNHVLSRPADPDSYTALWNLCCTPAFLAKTSDTHDGVKAMLKFRAYQLYGYLPADEPAPVEPEGFGELRWAVMPDALPDLEAALRGRLRAARMRRATQVAVRLGWCFSAGPDGALVAGG